MRKITIVGAGGFVFPTRLCIDILSFPELRDSLIHLYDINPQVLAKSRKNIETVIERNRLPTKLESSTNRRKALDGANYVIIAFQVGGVTAYKPDVEIPRRYGLDQCVGDTLGPGGVFRHLRSAVAFNAIAKDMKALCPDAIMIQYANPMAMNCWGLNLQGIKVVGLCHSVQGTSWELVQALGLPYDEVTWKCAGINHQAWFTEFRHEGKDVYPQLRETLFKQLPSPLVVTGGRHPKMKTIRNRPATRWPWESVRGELMRSFGYFQTESPHHASEYTPWFRKNASTVKAYIPNRWDYYRICCGYQAAADAGALRKMCEGPLETSNEYGSRIIYGMETGNRQVVYGNVPNWGAPGSDPLKSPSHLITNLPRNCCVEVACLVDRNGVQPVVYGDLPDACAAINRSNIGVQELAVKGAMNGDRTLVHQAVALDPLTGALLTLPQIRKMVDEMFAAERRWLPQFN